jgi:hypothetical protein
MTLKTWNFRHHHKSFKSVVNLLKNRCEQKNKHKFYLIETDMMSLCLLLLVQALLKLGMACTQHSIATGTIDIIIYISM